MFVGHVGAALGLKATGTRLSLGTLVFAALLLDVLLWTFVLAGIEQVIIPADFAARHYLSFVFPYSHGLLATIAWMIVGAVAVWFLGRGTSGHAPLIVAAAIGSHWILDFLVHVPDLPLTSAGSPLLGLGLWRHMPVALAVETSLALAGAWLYLRTARVTVRRALGLLTLLAAVAAFTVIGGTVAPAPPGATPLAAASLGTILGVAALAWWLEPRFL